MAMHSFNTFSHHNSYASQAVRFHPHGCQSDFVWLSARTPHGRTCGARPPDEIKKIPTRKKLPLFFVIVIRYWPIDTEDTPAGAIWNKSLNVWCVNNRCNELKHRARHAAVRL